MTFPDGKELAKMNRFTGDSGILRASLYFVPLGSQNDTICRLDSLSVSSITLRSAHWRGRSEAWTGSGHKCYC